MLKISLIACGTKMPPWVEDGMSHYKQRLTEYVDFKLIEIPLEKRVKSQSSLNCMQKEAAKMLQAIPAGSYVIALDSRGLTLTSEKLSEKLSSLPHHFSHLCLLIGGPDGIDASLLKLAREKWSLSALTLPHPLVRVVLIETLYRSFSILHHHPYHR